MAPPLQRVPNAKLAARHRYYGPGQLSFRAIKVTLIWRKRSVSDKIFETERAPFRRSFFRTRAIGRDFSAISYLATLRIGESIFFSPASLLTDEATFLEIKICKFFVCFRKQFLENCQPYCCVSLFRANVTYRAVRIAKRYFVPRSKPLFAVAPAICFRVLVKSSRTEVPFVYRLGSIVKVLFDGESTE